MLRGHLSEKVSNRDRVKGKGGEGEPILDRALTTFLRENAEDTRSSRVEGEKGGDLVDKRGKEKRNRIRRVISGFEKLEVEHPVDPRDNAFEQSRFVNYEALIGVVTPRHRPIPDGSRGRVIDSRLFERERTFVSSSR